MLVFVVMQVPQPQTLAALAILQQLLQMSIALVLMVVRVAVEPGVQVAAPSALVLVASFSRHILFVPMQKRTAPARAKAAGRSQIPMSQLLLHRRQKVQVLDFAAIRVHLRRTRVALAILKLLQQMQIVLKLIIARVAVAPGALLDVHLAALCLAKKSNLNSTGQKLIVQRLKVSALTPVRDPGVSLINLLLLQLLNQLKARQLVSVVMLVNLSQTLAELATRKRLL
jgi:hypothetical protein